MSELVSGLLHAYISITATCLRHNDDWIPWPSQLLDPAYQSQRGSGRSGLMISHLGRPKEPGSSSIRSQQGGNPSRKAVESRVDGTTMRNVRESRHVIRWREVGLQGVFRFGVMAHFDPET